MATHVEESLVSDEHAVQSKRHKLEDVFECVLIESDTECSDTVGHSNVQSKRRRVDINAQEKINSGGSECGETNSAILDSPIEDSELPLEDFNVNCTSTEVDPLSAECDSNIITAKQNLDDCTSVTHETHFDDKKHSSAKKLSLCQDQKTKQIKGKVFFRKDLILSKTEDADNSSILQTGNLIEENVSGADNKLNQNNCASSSGTNINGINKVDNLLTKNFSLFTFEEQLEIKTLGPHQPKSIQIYQTDTKQNRFFSEKWFEKVEWLTVSETTNGFFCFYCLLFGGESIWCKTGHTNIKNLSEKIKIHESTSVHLNNAFKYKTFGNMNVTSQLRIDPKNHIWQHNEMVDRNRNILNRILDSIKFCATRELPLNEDDENKCLFNRKIFLSLLTDILNFDGALNDHVQDLTSSTYTSEAAQNELLDCMYHVYQKELKRDIEKANFVSVQVEKIPDVSCKSHFAVILRFMKDGIAAERLLSLIEVEDRSAVGLTEALKKQLVPLDVRCKLIAQTYDGNVTMRGPYGGVQNFMKEFFPHALFVHSYAHSFGMIIRQACSTIQRIGFFFANVNRFSTFFQMPSKRTELLDSQSKKFPGIIESKWNCESEIIKTVYHNQLALLACCEIIEEGNGWNDASIWEATNLADLLEDEEFLFFVRFFNTVLNHVEVLHRSFQARKSCGDIMTALQDFETTIADMMETISEDTKTPDADFKAAANEACGVIISELRERFEATDHLITFSVIDPERYKNMPKFPHDHLQVLACRYRMLVQGKLTSELKVVYNNEAFAAVKSECALLNLLAGNELLETFSELRKLIEIALSTPVLPSHMENWVSTSAKLKNFMKPHMSPDRLNILTTIMIHQDDIENMTDFNSRVIEYFATKGIEKPELLYKT